MIIWNDIPDDPNRLPALTDDVLTEVEGRLGVKLPIDYLEAIRIQNAGDMSKIATYRLHGMDKMTLPSLIQLLELV